MKIKKGDKFLCIKDVKMAITPEFNNPHTRGKIYTSDEDGYITNNYGGWTSLQYFFRFNGYFKPLKDVDRMYTDATGKLRELHRNFTGNKIGNPDVADYFDNKDVNHEDFAFSAQSRLEGFYDKYGYDYVSEEVFIELNGLEEKSYDEDPYNWVNNGLQNISIKNTDEIVKSVIDKYRHRSEVGIKKYGTTLEDNDDGIETFLTHLQEEMMDATLYIEKLKRQFAELKKHL